MALLRNVTFSLFYFYFFCFAFIRKKILDVEIVMKTNFSKVSTRNLGFLLFRISCLCISFCEASTRHASVNSGSHQDPLLRSREELFASYLTPTSIKNRQCTRKSRAVMVQQLWTKYYRSCGQDCDADKFNASAQIAELLMWCIILRFEMMKLGTVVWRISWSQARLCVVCGRLTRNDIKCCEPCCSVASHCKDVMSFVSLKHNIKFKQLSYSTTYFVYRER